VLRISIWGSTLSTSGGLQRCARGGRRFALKLYADDAAPEAELYAALTAAGLAGEQGARVRDS